MTDQLSLYNGALRELGERRLASLADNVPARHDLDEIWDNGFVEDLLEHGMWNFALRTTELNYTSDLTPPFGFKRAFEKPVDWIRTALLCSDEYFRNPMTQVTDEQGYWFADLDIIYVGYISIDEEYGLNYGRWPKSFERWAECYLAFKISPRTAPDKEKDAFDKQKKFLVEARSRDAMNQATAIPTEGDWTRSRRGRSVRDRIGSTLIG